MTREPTIGYLECAGDDFISNVVINRNVVDLLGRFAEVVSTKTRPGDLTAGVIGSLGADYVLVDLHNFGFIPFVIREQRRLDVRFIVVLHTVHAWAGLLLYTLPFIKPGDVVLAPSQSARRSALRIAAGLDVHVLPYCLDVQAVREACAGTEGRGRPSIAFLGRLVPAKGVGLLVDCLPAIRREAGDVGLEIIGPLSGGSTSDEPVSPFVAGLREHARRIGLADHVAFRGARVGADKYARLSSSSAFVYPTTYAGETAAFSILEAMACGLPVVATRHAGVAELVVDGGNGLLVNVRHETGRGLEVDRRGLVTAVARLLRDADLAERLRAGARATAAARDFRVVMPTLIELLRRHRTRPVPADWSRFADTCPLALDALFTTGMRSLCRRAGAGIETFADAHRAVMQRLAQSGTSPARLEESDDSQPDGDGELYRYLCLS